VCCVGDICTSKTKRFRTLVLVGREEARERWMPWLGRVPYDSTETNRRSAQEPCAHHSLLTKLKNQIFEEINKSDTERERERQSVRDRDRARLKETHLSAYFFG
jgi:hypothetical protein